VSVIDRARDALAAFRGEPMGRPLGVLRTITFDCEDVWVMQRFWMATLEYGEFEEPDLADPFFENLREAGVPEEGLRSRGGAAYPGRPVLYFQQVPEAKTAKNRMHLDIVVPDARAKVKELVALGATVQPESQPSEIDLAFDRAFDSADDVWIFLRDPEGNEFCVGETQASRTGRDG
jgi:hypothetical protein